MLFLKLTDDKSGSYRIVTVVGGCKIRSSGKFDLQRTSVELPPLNVTLMLQNSTCEAELCGAPTCDVSSCISGGWSITCIKPHACTP